MGEKQHNSPRRRHHGENQTTEVKIKQEWLWDAELGGEKKRDGGEFVLILISFYVIRRSESFKI